MENLTGLPDRHDHMPSAESHGSIHFGATQSHVGRSDYWTAPFTRNPGTACGKEHCEGGKTVSRRVVDEGFTLL